MSKKYRKVYTYIAVFEPDKEIGGYSAHIPALPGCISEGDTFEEALKNITEAAKLYIGVMGGKENTLYQSESVIVAPIGIRI